MLAASNRNFGRRQGAQNGIHALLLRLRAAFAFGGSGLGRSRLGHLGGRGLFQRPHFDDLRDEASLVRISIDIWEWRTPAPIDMSQTSSAKGRGPFIKVVAFALGRWRRQGWLVGLISALFLVQTLADVLMPLYAGRLIDAISSAHPDLGTRPAAAP